VAFEILHGNALGKVLETIPNFSQNSFGGLLHVKAEEITVW
jgi:hypothetical protein